MKNAAFLLLLLAASFQAAAPPAARHDDPAETLQYRTHPGEPLPNPAESPTALKRLTDAQRIAGPVGNVNPQDGLFTARSGGARSGGAVSSQMQIAGHARVNSLPPGTFASRAPPAAPLL